MNVKRITLFLLTLILFSNAVSYASFTPENNIIASKIVHTISDGLKYISSVEVCEGVRQEIFAFDYSPNSQTRIAASYGDYIYGFNSVGSMISAYQGDGRVVGGINTDFYITSTGIPLSCLISEKEIITSCDDRVAIGFNANGDAVIGKPVINAEIISADGQRSLPVAHINKTPAIWGVYLLTDKFSSTTRSSINSIEIIFKPVPEADELLVSEEKSVSEDEITYSESMDSEVDVINKEQDISEYIIEEISETDDSTDNEANEESIILPEVSDDVNLKLFPNDSIKTVVADIRYNVTNGDIPSNCFVACIPFENFSYLADGINIGDEYYINTSCSDEFADCINIFGAGTIIVDNGLAVPQENNSVFKYRQPRTAAGIREDGTVMFVCVDGRKPGVSSGYTITELSDYLISHGCIKAVNFDGGGSTTFYAADTGKPSSELMNTPSDGNERRVADGLLFVNTSQPTGEVYTASVYPTEFYILNDESTLELNVELLFADSAFYPLEVDIDRYSLTLDESYGVINEGIFYPSGKVGIADIFAVDNENGMSFAVGKIVITDIVDKISFSTNRSILTPFEDETEFSISTYLNTIPIIASLNNMEFTITRYGGTSDDGEIYIPVDESYAYVDIESSKIVIVKKGEKYRISVSVGGITESIDLVTEAYPFTDAADHWSADTVYNMYNKGLFVGELNGDGTSLFYPDRNMTRAEFCVVLARVLGLNDVETNYSVLSLPDINLYTPIDVPEWALSQVNALLSRGYISELVTVDQSGRIVLDSEKMITRMDVIRVLGALLQSNVITDDMQPTAENTFSDFVPERVYDNIYLQNVVSGGIIKGYEDGTLRQNGNLTRAEAATVFSRFIASRH